jgi:pyruvate formate lyase activating enzyme
MIAPINKIIDFSTVDGIGLRTSIFFQGCNISCLYCHNPETNHLCNNCGACVDACQNHALSIKDSKVIWNKDLCISCDKCISICKNHASPKIMYLTPMEVFDSIKRNLPFIRGITASGGECMLYPEFLKELFKLAKESNLGTLLDSNGMVLYEDYEELMNYTDGVMLDIKAWDKEVYRRLTGYTNENVKRNLVYLAKKDKLSEIRIVYLDSYVDMIDILNGIKELIPDKYENIKLKLITFRRIGVKSILSDYKSPSIDTMNQFMEYAKSIGFKYVELR